MSELQPTHVGAEGARIRLEELSLAMCGGTSLPAYLDEFRAQGESQCTNVWSKGIIAYRCRSCQTNDSSAICVECFQKGDHWKHDYVMYHSESGGCCDCGDRAAWKESGFCSTHQRLHVQEAKVKVELEQATHDTVRYVLKELLAWVKKLHDKLSNHPSLSEEETSGDETMAMIYLEWSLKVCAVDALRSIVCKDIIKYDITYQIESSTSPLGILLDCLGWMPEQIIVAETTLFLQLLYKNEFKVEFLKILKGKYKKMIILAVDNDAYMLNYKHLDTNLDRVMVQLFNDPVMTTSLVHDHNLLELFIGVFSSVISCSAKNFPPAVSVDHNAIKWKVYLRPQGDLRLIVSHEDIAVHLLSKQEHLFPEILAILYKLQWINPYTRVQDHIEFENSWTLAIQLEMNSMAIVFQLISRCYQDPKVGKKTLLTAATYTVKALRGYLEQAKRIVEQGEDSPLSSRFVSLHIPLHRTLSAILQKLVLLPWDNHQRGFLSALLDNHNIDVFTEDEVLRLMEHPLRILVWMAQIRAQMWRRTSEEFSRLELIYRGSFWHDQSMDMDILLLQFCTVALENMQETVFVKIAEQFDFKEMTTSRLTPKVDRPKHQIAVLQDFMRLVLLIVRERRNLGKTGFEESQEKCLRYDVIQWLCVRDQTYSQLCRALSAVPMDHERLNIMLNEVAIYHGPKVVDRGYFQLKLECWKEFDPLFAHYYLNELEDAEDRAVKVGKLKNYWRITAPPAARAPYDRLSSLLHTKACHMFLLNVLGEVEHLVEESTTATAGEALGVTALQMMAVLVSDSRDNIRNVDSEIKLPVGPQDEFPTEDIAVNIRVPIRMDSSILARNPTSIYDMLQSLQHANDCTRLVDSANHVLELLCFSSNEKSLASKFDSQGDEDVRRRLLKEQRQKAILEEFAAKRFAFMEHLDVSDDNDDLEEGFEEDSQMEVSELGRESLSYISSNDSASEKVVNTVLREPETDHLAMETSSETKECALCKRKKDDKNSPTCWIAFVQRYNFPCQVLNRAKPVENISDLVSLSNFSQSTEVRPTGGGLDLLVTVGISGDRRVPSAIDYTTMEHVQCCGHQMHWNCFHDFMRNLSLSPTGSGVVDPSKAEFQCPTCRRLANVLLPDVEASLSSRKIDIREDSKGIEEPGKSWSRFWQSNQSLVDAVDFFCRQVLKVQAPSPQSTLDRDLNEFQMSQVLWEALVFNVMHWEVETRDGSMKSESASSSSAPVKLSDECTWGGDTAHWMALRELGRLTMLSNTFPHTAHVKSQFFQRLRTCLGLRETSTESDIGVESSINMSGISELEKILQDIFPRNWPCFEESENSLENSASAPMPNVVSVQENEEAVAPKSTVPVRSPLLEESKDSSCNDHEYAEPQHDDHHVTHYGAPNAQVSVPQAFPLQKYENAFEDSPEGQAEPEIVSNIDPIRILSPEHRPQLSQEDLSKLRECGDETVVELSPIEQPSPAPSAPSSQEALKKRREWIQDLLKNGVLTADPLMLLLLLLIIFPGQPGRSSLDSMVKFAYTTAVLQSQKAVARLNVDNPNMEALVQSACLPFLRRAAMLVQVITREDFRGQHGLSGTKVMDFKSLQLLLQLPDCSQILRPHFPGSKKMLGTEILELHKRVFESCTFELRKVSLKASFHVLPLVFQELLLVNIHNKKRCTWCKKMPEDPAICLICGMLLCCSSDCCRVDGIGECSRHAAKESAGVGIFLLLRSTQLLLLRNNRTCMGLSLYLDVHGEEDLYLRRSQLLYLSDLRLSEIRRLWMTAAFDYDSYILRNSQSRPIAY